MSSTLSGTIPLPMGAEWWMQGEDSSNADGSLAAACHAFALRTSELLAQVNAAMATRQQHQSDKTLLLDSLAHQIQALDREIADWLSAVPPESQFQTACWVSDVNISADDHKANDLGNRQAFPGRVDIYPDYVTASMWNISRVTRLLLASLAIRISAARSSDATAAAAAVDYRSTPEFAAAWRTCEAGIADIIASVPYHLGWPPLQRLQQQTTGFACGVDNNNNGSHGNSGSEDDHHSHHHRHHHHHHHHHHGYHYEEEHHVYDAPQPTSARALPALFLMWPLTCIKNLDMASAAQRAWVKGRLRFIDEAVGLKYARVVNEVNFSFPFAPSCPFVPWGGGGPDSLAGTALVQTGSGSGTEVGSAPGPT